MNTILRVFMLRVKPELNARKFIVQWHGLFENKKKIFISLDYILFDYKSNENVSLKMDKSVIFILCAKSSTENQKTTSRSITRWYIVSWSLTKSQRRGTPALIFHNHYKTWQGPRQWCPPTIQLAPLYDLRQQLVYQNCVQFQCANAVSKQVVPCFFSGTDPIFKYLTETWLMTSSNRNIFLVAGLL